MDVTAASFEREVLAASATVPAVVAFWEPWCAPCRALAPIPGEDDASRDPPPKYINSPESPIYTKGSTLFGLWQARHAIRQQEHAVIVEGNFDVVSLHARGVENVVAPLGTDDLLGLLCRPTAFGRTRRDEYEARIASKRWRELWPKVRFVDE